MNKLSLILTALILGTTLTPIKAIAATFSQLIVYGDSLSDLGRAFTATEGLVPPYGNLTGGRFSNNLVWVEYLANRLNLPTNPNTNFAIGGATTGTVNTIKTDPELPDNLPNVDDLIGLENQVNNNLINDPNALYIVWAGANDYLGGGILNPAEPITNLSNSLTTLINNGAKNILVANLPNLGELPLSLNTSDSLPLNLLTQAHNNNLETAINTLQLTFPKTDIDLLDVNTLFENVQANPSLFGFTNVTDSCLLVDCTNPNEYFFFDPFHPNTVAHKLISNLAVKSLGIPEPNLIIGLITFTIGSISLKNK